MIIDVDTHMSPYRNVSISIDAAEWNEKMISAGVDKALCWLMPQQVSDVTESNRYLYESSKKYDKIIPFGWANVGGEGVSKSLRDVEQCIGEFGFKGVKINGAQNCYYIDSKECFTVCDKIATMGGIIAFHIGADEPDFTSPLRAEKIARAFPETTILMVHMGGAAIPDCSDYVIDIAINNPNMMLIGSALPAASVANGIKRLGADRIMFGSDTPFFDIHKSIEDYRKMLVEFGSDVAEKVMGLNAKRILHL